MITSDIMTLNGVMALILQTQRELFLRRHLQPFYAQCALEATEIWRNNANKGYYAVQGHSR